MFRRTITFTLILLVGWGSLSGCAGQLTPEAQQLLQEAYELHGGGNDEVAIQALDRFLRDNRRSSRADEAYYLRGMAKYRLKNISAAKADLNTAIGRTDNKELRINARIALADLAYAEDDVGLAENMYRQALVDIEEGKAPSDHAHYRLGTLLQRQGRWEEADLQFDRVAYLFADSQLGRASARRTRSTAWTIQVGAFESKARSDLAAKHLRVKELPTVSKAILLDGRLVFVVQVGRFSTYEQALAVLDDARELEGDAFVTTTR